VAEPVLEPREQGAGARAARGTLWLSAGAWGAKGAQTVSLLVLARLLAPSQLGVLALAAMAYNVLAAINSMGVADALTWRQDRAREAAGTALSLMVGLGLALTAAAWVAAPWLARFFHSPESSFVVRGFALAITFDAASTVPVALLTRAMSFRRRALTDSVPALASGATMVAVVAAGHPLGGLVAGQLVQGVGALAVALAVGPRVRPGWDRRLAQELLSYGSHLGGAAVALLALLNVDYLVVGHVLGPVQLGYYSLAFRICYVPYLAVSFVANGAAFPYYCRLGSPRRLGQAAGRVLALVNLASAPAYAGLALFAGDVVLLGHKWAPAAACIRWLAAYGMGISVVNSAQCVLKAAGRPGRLLAGRLVHLGALTLVLVAVASRGIVAVSAAQAAVAAAVAALSLAWMAGAVPVSLVELARGLGLPVVAAGAMAAVYLAARPLSPGPSWASLTGLGAASLAGFLAASWALEPGTWREGWRLLRARAQGAG
jgi:O-antigen/teichoic acid export membrane protein